jgi:hypothetical protein
MAQKSCWGARIPWRGWFNPNTKKAQFTSEGLPCLSRPRAAGVVELAKEKGYKKAKVADISKEMVKTDDAILFAILAVLVALSPVAGYYLQRILEALTGRSGG